MMQQLISGIIGNESRWTDTNKKIAAIDTNRKIAADEW